MINIKKQVLNVSKDFLLEKISFEELKEYSKFIDIKDIDGELIRSYFIVYKNGILEVWNKLLLENNEENLKLEITTEIEILIEEALEEVDFDNIFSSTLEAIKCR